MSPARIAIWGGCYDRSGLSKLRNALTLNRPHCEGHGVFTDKGEEWPRSCLCGGIAREVTFFRCPILMNITKINQKSMSVEPPILFDAPVRHISRNFKD